MFKNWDDVELSREKYHYGDTVVVPKNPTKAADETYTYAFAGWDKTVTKVTGDATYTATYTPVYIEYTVVFKNWDGVELSREKYHYGDAVVVPKNPTKAADETYTYAFAGWDKNVTTVTGDATYTATYTPAYIEYTVVFKNWDGVELSREKYYYGDTVVVPKNPTKAADETYTYVFAGWDKTVTEVTGDATYTATYTPAYIEYTVVFKNWDGAELSREQYHYGDSVVVPENPTKAADKVYAYAFAGWSTEMEGSVTQYPAGTKIPNVEGEVTYNAYFTKTVVGLRGDVNDDGRVTVSDVARTNAYVKGVMTLTAEELLVADVNADGQVDDDDILHLSNEILGKGHVYEQGACTICGSVLGDMDLGGEVNADDLTVLD